MAVSRILKQIHRRLDRLNRKKNKRRKAKSNGSYQYESLEPRRLLNAAPVATADRFYFTSVNTNLNVQALGGLLANDFDLEDDINVDTGKKAREISQTQQGGSLLAYDTGAFTYIPPNGFTGIDTFYYRAEDTNLSLSKRSAVNIAVGTGLSAQLNAAEFSGGGLLHTGALETTQPLGGGLELNYRSDSIPTPIVAVETFLIPGTAIPDSISVTTVFDGIEGETTLYNTEDLNPDEPLRFVQRALTPDLQTGIYDWTMTVTLRYDNATDIVNEFHGQQTVINRSDSEFGVGWWLTGVDRLHVAGDGALLVNSDGSTLHFPFNGTEYEPAAGDQTYSTLIDHGNGLTLTDKWGDERRFDPSGRLIAVKRLNNVVDEFTYQYSLDRLETITDQFGRTYDFSYNVAGHLASVNDFANRDTIVTISDDGLLTQVVVADEPATGDYPGYVAPQWNFGYVTIGGNEYLRTVTDPNSLATSYDYKLATRRIRSITYGDDSRFLLIAALTQGYTGEGEYSVYHARQSNPRFTSSAGVTIPFSTDGAGNTTEYVDAAGHDVILDYDLTGQIVKYAKRFPNSTEPITIADYGYSELGDLVLLIGIEGSIQTAEYDSVLHLVTTKTYEDTLSLTSTTELFDYDPVGNLNQYQHETAGTWTYQYDNHGNRIQETRLDTDGNGPEEQIVTAYHHTADIYNLITSIEVDNELIRQYPYTTADLPASYSAAAGDGATFAYGL